MKYSIVIPSRERAKWLMDNPRTNTLNYMSELNPSFYVRHDDSQLAAYNTLCSSYGIEPIVYDASKIFGAAQTYDKLIDEAIERGDDCLLIVDDDLSFVTPNPIPNGSPMFVKAQSHMLKKLCDHMMELLCPQLPIMSFTPIQKRTQASLIAYAEPMMMVYGLYLPHFKSHPTHRFWQGIEIEGRCDHNLTLKLLIEGYLTGLLVSCLIPQNVNNPGGASVFRDLQMEETSVKYLTEHFPDFVRTYKKRGWVGDPTVLRNAPIISWKKAFNRDAFISNFGESPRSFAERQIKHYNKIYIDFVEELRK